MERPVQKEKNVNTKSDCEMWEREVFGSPLHVCSVNRQRSVFLGEGNAHIVGSGDRGYGPAQGLSSQVETNNKMKVS